MGVSKVLMICTAYEQGVGYGQRWGELHELHGALALTYSKERNPYGEGTDEAEAWGLGWDEGSGGRAPSVSDPPLVDTSVLRCPSCAHLVPEWSATAVLSVSRPQLCGKRPEVKTAQVICDLYEPRPEGG
jgi:hypothetical protein